VLLPTLLGTPTDGHACGGVQQFGLSRRKSRVPVTQTELSISEAL